MATSQQLSSIATDIVVAKVVEDKLKSLEKGTREGKETADGCCAAPRTEEPNACGASDPPEERGSLDDDLTNWREQRLRQLKEKKQQEAARRQQGGGRYEEIIEEEFLPTVTKASHAVVHFFSHSFERCKVMDKHLTEVAMLHPETRFVKLNAEKAPFFCQKLAIRCLPSVVLFKDGVALHTLVGFAELGGIDDFPRKKLEKVLLKYKVIDPILGEQYSEGEEEEDEAEKKKKR